VFLPETTDAENFGELVRAAAADLVGDLLGPAIAPGCHRLADQ
jgi:hypothetical protein